jgi:hypothetical protein
MRMVRAGYVTDFVVRSFDDPALRNARTDIGGPDAMSRLDGEEKCCRWGRQCAAAVVT